MNIDSNFVIAIATSVYGLATFFLVVQLWRDRAQRERHFKADNDAKKLAELHSAFYEAWGFWLGHNWAQGSVRPDAAQVGKQFEALTRLECQLRLNGYEAEAGNLGFAIRVDLAAIRDRVEDAGRALGLLAERYSSVVAAGFRAGAS